MSYTDHPWVSNIKEIFHLLGASYVHVDDLFIKTSLKKFEVFRTILTFEIKICPFSLSFKSTNTEKCYLHGKIVYIFLDCDSRNVIYCFVCSGCGQKYTCIGQTGDILRNRVTVQTQDEDKRMWG